jgi:hypothetical protein
MEEQIEKKVETTEEVKEEVVETNNESEVPEEVVETPTESSEERPVREEKDDFVDRQMNDQNMISRYPEVSRRFEATLDMWNDKKIDSLTEELTKKSQAFD